MPVAPKKPRKLYAITQTEARHNNSPSTYYATGEDAHEVYSRMVAHDEKEGNFSHSDMIDVTVQVEEVDLEALPEFLAWEMG